MGPKKGRGVLAHAHGSAADTQQQLALLRQATSPVIPVMLDDPATASTQDIVMGMKLKQKGLILRVEDDSEEEEILSGSDGTLSNASQDVGPTQTTGDACSPPQGDSLPRRSVPPPNHAEAMRLLAAASPLRSQSNQSPPHTHNDFPVPSDQVKQTPTDVTVVGPTPSTGTKSGHSEARALPLDASGVLDIFVQMTDQRMEKEVRGGAAVIAACAKESIGAWRKRFREAQAELTQL
jgi:hypothetical protein